MKKFKISYLLYIFILLSPIFDAGSLLIRTYFPNLPVSPTLILRPLIPLILIIYIFFREKKYRPHLIVISLIYLIYGLIHLYITHTLMSGISYSTITEEATYVINYTYNIYLLIIIYYFTKNNEIPQISKYLFIMLIEYLFIIYFSIITKTSFSTYPEGNGYRSYFLSGNSISTILLLLFSTLINKISIPKLKDKLITILTFLLLGIYLIFLVGTRTGLLGYFLIIIVYLILSFILKLLKHQKINKKLIIIVPIIFLITLLGIITLGSETLERRKVINELDNSIIDVNTNEPGHTTGDTGVIVWQIKHDIITEDYINKPTQEAYLDLYEFANKYNLNASNNRLQQLIYHISLVNHQKNIFYILFGNGRGVHYGEMILEMEIFSLLFNFGIVGFILYLGPFLYLFIIFLKHTPKRKPDLEYLMNIFGILLSLFLSLIAGYVFFSSTCALIISLILNNLQKNNLRGVT